MVQIRYLLYFVGISLLTWLLTQMEIIAPGSLRLLVYADPGDTLGTSEYSPVVITQDCNPERFMSNQTHKRKQNRGTGKQQR